MKVAVDFAITLLNRDHFSENQTFATKGVKFTSDAKSKISIAAILFIAPILKYVKQNMP